MRFEITLSEVSALSRASVAGEANIESQPIRVHTGATSVHIRKRLLYTRYTTAHSAVANTAEAPACSVVAESRMKMGQSNIIIWMEALFSQR